MPPWGIALIVLGVLIFLAVIFIFILNFDYIKETVQSFFNEKREYKNRVKNAKTKEEQKDLKKDYKEYKESIKASEKSKREVAFTDVGKVIDEALKDELKGKHKYTLEQLKELSKYKEEKPYVRLFIEDGEIVDKVAVDPKEVDEKIKRKFEKEKGIIVIKEG